MYARHEPAPSLQSMQEIILSTLLLLEMHAFDGMQADEMHVRPPNHKRLEIHLDKACRVRENVFDVQISQTPRKDCPSASLYIIRRAGVIQHGCPTKIIDRSSCTNCQVRAIEAQLVRDVGLEPLQPANRLVYTPVRL